jgi:hypothetical protein
MRCGHCKEPDVDIEHVRKCADVPHVEDDKPSGMSENQQNYLDDLLHLFGLKLEGDLTPATISYESGHPILSALIVARRHRTMGQDFELPPGVVVLSNPSKGKPRERVSSIQSNLPDVPQGYYAVHNWKNGEELKFFFVKKPKTGEWAGFTFVKEVIGGHPEMPVRGKYMAEALKAIVKFGIDDAGVLYGLRIKHCCRCNISLTKKASRVLGLGRHCAYERGKGEEWDDLNFQFDDADAEDDE